ncbi:hypothetical protein GQ53DRAFT_846935 [Thozetella sp. PMI_491]|nr:hypothetical protein GQ53DRAFT_846935 [Thozetella sp. PMI_491]
MTRKNKCDACRKAKIKCDEARPRCSQCLYRGKTCTHNWALRDLAFVQVTGEIVDGVTNLGLEAQEQMSSVDPVAVSPRSKVRLPRGTLPPPTNSIKIVGNDIFYRRSKGSSLLARWVSIIVAGEGIPRESFQGYGDWMIYIPQYIGNSRPIDDAVTCLIDCRVVLLNPTEKNRQAVRASNRAAVSSIAAILEAGPQFCSGDVLLAIQTLYLVESMLKHIATAIIHVTGLLALLKQYDKRLKASSINDDLISRQIFMYNASSGVLPALISGKNHELDDPEWLSYSLPPLSAPGIPDAILQAAASNTTQACILIPRLAALIHRLAASPADLDLEQAALDVAQKMLSLRLDDRLLSEPFSSGQFHYKTTTLSSVSDLVPMSYDFEAGRLVMLFRSCWLGRLLVCGLVDTLMETSDLAARSIDATEVHAEDVRMATNALMSTQSALVPSTRGDLIAQRIQDNVFLSMLIPSYGTWERAERRARASATGGHEELVGGAPRASLLKQLTFDYVHVFQERCGNPQNTKEQLKDIVGFLTARPTGLKVVLVNRDL